MKLHFIEIPVFSADFRKKKLSDIELYENPSRGSRVVPCGRTDIHDEISTTFFRNCAKAPEINYKMGKRNTATGK